MRRWLTVATVGATALALAVVVWLTHPEAALATATGPYRPSTAGTPAPTRSFAPRPDDDVPGTLVGQVLDEQGAPRAGAVVALVWLDEDADAEDPELRQSSGDDDELDALPDLELARTDGRGRFRFDTDRIGRARLTATAGAALAVASDELTVPARDAKPLAPITLRLGATDDAGALPATRVEARTREPEGSPVIDALVFARLPGAGLIFAARSDGTGAASMALPGWPLTLYARADGYEDAALTANPAMRRGVVVDGDLVLVPGATLSGRVVVEGSGAPAAGARVRTHGEGRARRGTRAGADGRFRLTVAAGEVTVRARRGALVGVSAPLSLERAQSAEVLITIGLGARLTGVVTDDDNRPIAGVRVRADGVSAVTSADGAFVLDGIQRWDAQLSPKVRVEATHPDYCSTSEEVELAASGDTPVELGLSRCHALTGVVLAPDGTPAAGASVEVDGAHPTTADPAGRFRVGGIRPRDDEYDVVASTADATAKLTVAADDLDRPITIRLERAAVVCGVVRDEEERPIARTEVEAAQDGQRRVRADARGAWCVGPLDEGEVALSADDGDSVSITLARGERRDGVALVAAARHADIRGVVVDNTAAPVWGAHLTGCGTSATSAADGSFTLPAPTDARCGYIVRAPGYIQAMAELDAGDDEARVTLERTPRFAGEVVDEAGRPVTRFSLLVRRSDATHDLRDPRGAFDIAVEQPGSYSLFVRTPDGRSGATPFLDAEPGQTVRVRVVLGSACVLRGRVVDPNGRPAPVVFIFVGDLPADRLDGGRFAIAIPRDGGRVTLRLVTTTQEEREVTARCDGELDDIVIERPPPPERRGSESEEESRAPEEESR